MSNPVTHKVVSGDTLFSLGKKYGLTVAELKSINNLTSDTIKVGQILKLTPFTHTVVSGDTLFSLAKKHNTTVDTLKSLNGLKSDTIKVGQVLRLPEKYDEQFLLLNDEGIAFANFDYTIELCNGTTQTGRTDNNGYTQRIIADYCAKVINITIHENVDLTCCNQHTNVASVGGYTFNLNSTQNPTTLSSQGLGTSTKTTKLQAKGRPLTNGEIALAQIIFGNSIDYGKVRVHHGKYIFFQENTRAMTPNGHIYWGLSKNDAVILDASLSTDNRVINTFVHELVHVWQYQLNYSIKWKAFLLTIRGGYHSDSNNNGLEDAYDYTPWLATKNDFSEFNLEQQGRMIEEYFSNLRAYGFIDIKQLLDSSQNINSQYVSSTRLILQNNPNGILNHVINSDVLRILNRFMSTPNDKTLLPTTTNYPK